MRRAAPVLLLLASIATLLVVRGFAHPSSLDLLIYRGEGLSVRTGASLFDFGYRQPGDPTVYQATYPPFAALLFLPLSYLPANVVVVIGLVTNLLLLGVAVRLSRRLVRLKPSWQVVFVGVAALMWTEPVYTTFQNGQINLLLLALILRDFTRPARSRLTGIGIGVAAGIKVTPVIFICYLIATRRLREAAVAAATFAGTVVLSALLLPDATWQFWTRLLFDSRRVGRLEKVANQSLRGLLVRLEHTRGTAPVELLLIVLAVAAGLGCAVLAYRRLGDAWGVPACGVTALLVSPISWTHHWVWCVPVAILLWRHERRALAGMLVFWTFLVWGVPHKDGGAELHFDAVQVVLSGWYVLFGLAFLVGTAVRAARHAPRTSPAVLAHTAAGASPGRPSTT